MESRELKLNWQTIGQFIAAASIVLSLVFVGYEIRQNSAVSRMTAYQNWQTGARDVATMMITDPLLIPLLVKLSNGSTEEDFDQAELMRIQGFFLLGIRSFEDVYRSVSAGILPNEALNVILSNSGGGWTQSALYRKIWDNNIRSSVSQEFATFFEERLERIQTTVN